MKLFLILCFSLTSITLSLTSGTVLITHGQGTSAIKFYKDSKYIQTIETSAKKLGHKVKGVAWLSPNDPNKNYAGLHPQERIAGAVIIAKAIIDERKNGQEVVLIGHSFGGQVMQCASRLLNPANKSITNSFIYDLVCSIKEFLECKEKEINQNTRSISPEKIIESLVTGWHLSKVVIDTIEKTSIINQHLINYVKKHISMDHVKEIKESWENAFTEIQKYKNKNNITHTNAIATLYTIGTSFTNSDIFTADMNVVNHHVNFYSTEDSVPLLFGTPCAPTHERTTNLCVYFEPQRSYAPTHQIFCGNILMAPWILFIPTKLQIQHIEKFDQFSWGKNGAVTFFANQAPTFQQG